MQKVVLKGTKSKIVKNNGNVLYIEKIPGMEGSFRKDQHNTFVYGRMVCDYIKNKYNCAGFFTSDELPNYGISNEETKMIFQSMNKKKHDGALLIICAYKRRLSEKIVNRVVDIITKEEHKLLTSSVTNQDEILHNLRKTLTNVS